MWKYISCPASTQSTEKVSNYMHFMEIPLKCVGCWDWYKKPQVDIQIFINNIHLSLIMFILTNVLLSLIVYLYTDWTDVMASLDIMGDGLPLVTSIFIVAYFAMNKSELYGLMDFMNNNFKWNSARGLTNMTMTQSYTTARNFAYFYTACTLFSFIVYVFIPIIVHLWTNKPFQQWIYMDVTQGPFIVIIFVRQCLAQGFVVLAIGQFGVFFACNSILLCGQLDLLCCCLRNVRYSALLQHGVHHRAIASQFSGIRLEEEHSYLYSQAEMTDSCYHYDEKLINLKENRKQFDIYSPEYDHATMAELQNCAHMFQVIKEHKDRFEKFVSPLLVLRVVQVTIYFCTLLYAATIKMDTVTVEYLIAVVLDIYVYCYFGNQIILQADRVSTAAFQSAWPAMGVRPRRLLLNILLANRKPMLVRAGSFLPMNLRTFLLIIKTSFSYYTLLVHMNE